MIKIIKIFIVIILTFSISKEISAKIEDALYATVGNEAITRSDIINEMRLILILTNQSLNENNKKVLEQSAIMSIIKRTIKKIELKDKNFTDFNKAELNLELNKKAKGLDLNLDELKMRLEANEVSYSKLVDIVKVELLWNGLIYAIFKNQLSVNENEIEEKLKLITKSGDVSEYLLSELIFRPESMENIESDIEKIKTRIKSEGFENVAKIISISESALQGGDLGWINENVITKQFKSVIAETKVGDTSSPIMLKEGILFFKVRDKRKIKPFNNLEEARNNLINAEKSKILKMYSLTHYNNIKKSITINYY